MFYMNDCNFTVIITIIMIISSTITINCTATFVVSLSPYESISLIIKSSLGDLILKLQTFMVPKVLHKLKLSERNGLRKQNQLCYQYPIPIQIFQPPHQSPVPYHHIPSLSPYQPPPPPPPPPLTIENSNNKRLILKEREREREAKIILFP